MFNGIFCGFNEHDVENCDLINRNAGGIFDPTMIFGIFGMGCTTNKNFPDSS